MGSISGLVPNQIIGNLRILKRIENGKNGVARFLVRCERMLETGSICNTEKIVIGSNLVSGRSDATVSCGCWRNKITHGAARKSAHTGAFRSWEAMKQRPKVRPSYADRPVCSGYESFETFLADLGERPPGQTIERVRNDDGYWCGHCTECLQKGWKANLQWATIAQQNRNTSRTKMLEYGGKTMCIADWAKERGIAGSALRYRIAAGWSVEDAISTPPSKQSKA